MGRASYTTGKDAYFHQIVNFKEREKWECKLTGMTPSAILSLHNSVDVIFNFSAA